MKTKSKALLLTLCAVLLVAASVLGTMAYLTSTDTVTNTFTVGKVSLGDKQSAGLDEAKVNENGQPVKEVEKEDGTKEWAVCEKAEAPRVDANTYKLVPGHSYTKDPTIHVGSDSEDCYLFVKVENGISAIEATGDTTIAKQMETLGWKEVTGKTGVYVYYGTTDGKVNNTRALVKADADVVVFNSFTLAGTADVAQYKDAQIVVTAYGIQADGLSGKLDADVWALLEEAYTTTPGGTTSGGTTGDDQTADGGVAGK